MYLVMTEKFDNTFHKRYVGGSGEVQEKPIRTETEFRVQTYEDVLEEYRWYMRDANAELPQAIMEELRTQGKI